MMTKNKEDGIEVTAIAKMTGIKNTNRKNPMQKDTEKKMCEITIDIVAVTITEDEIFSIFQAVQVLKGTAS